MYGELDWVNFTAQEAAEFGLLPLVAWREARNQGYAGMLAVAWTVCNRVKHPSWMGNSYKEVILKHYQYSSFNWNDPNSQRFPLPYGCDWQEALRAAVDAFTKSVPDPTGGAVNYFDHSIQPPKWATDGSMIKTCDVGAFSFYRLK